MAIKKTINGAAPIMTTKIKAPNLKKAVVGIKKDEQIIKPQEEVIEEVESVITEIPTEHIDALIQQPISAIPETRFEIDREENNSQKINQEKKFAKIALCVGIGFLVLMIFNKK